MIDVNDEWFEWMFDCNEWTCVNLMIGLKWIGAEWMEWIETMEYFNDNNNNNKR